jgi:hypothetical protein
MMVHARREKYSSEPPGSICSSVHLLVAAGEEGYGQGLGGGAADRRLAIPRPPCPSPSPLIRIPPREERRATCSVFFSGATEPCVLGDQNKAGGLSFREAEREGK